MSASTISRTPLVDDDGSGTTGTLWEDAWLQSLYDEIDGLFKRTTAGDLTLELENTDTTSTSDTGFIARVGSGAAGDAYYQALNGTVTWTWGLDNSDSDAFVLAASAALGTTNVLRATSAGVSVPGTFGVTGVATFSASVDLSGASAGQIAFPATQNPSAGVNTLDDYEEGTWTPVLGGSGGTSGQTYTTQVGSYIKIGKLVWATGYIVLSVKGTITTNVQIQGLPFTSENTTNLIMSGNVGYFTNLATNWVFIAIRMGANATVANIAGMTAAAATVTALTTTDINNNTEFAFSLVYRASA